jgi:hypothetical protein
MPPALQITGEHGIYTYDVYELPVFAELYLKARRSCFGLSLFISSMPQNKIPSVNFLEVCVLKSLIKIYLMMNIDAMGKMGVCFLTIEEGNLLDIWVPECYPQSLG